MGNILKHLNNSATPQNFEKSQVGTILHYLVQYYDLTAGAGHLRPDTTNVVTSPDATDLATLQTLLTEIKTDYTAHIAVTAPTHLAADATNTIAAADATDLATSLTLAIELIDELPDHLALETAHYQADTGTPALVHTDSPTTLAECIVVANECKALYNTHVAKAILQPGGTTHPLLGDIGIGGV